MSIHQFTGVVVVSTAASIQAPQWWRDKYSLASDLSFFSPFVTSNSFDHYTLGLSVCGNARMGKAVDDTACYDRAVYYLQSIMGLATTQAGGFLGWKSVEDGNVETSLREIYCWRFAPELLEFIQPLPAYAAAYAQIKGFLEDNIWSKWYSRGVNANIYRSVIHIASHWAKLALYLRTEGSTSTIRSQANTVLEAIDHVGMPNWGMKHIRTQLLPHPAYDGAYIWAQFWTGDLTTEPFGSDVSHGEGHITYASEAIRQGYDIWGMDDVLKYLGAAEIYWDGFEVATATNWNNLIGPPCGTTWAGKYCELGTLGQFDRNFQQRLEDDEVRGIADGAEKWGTFALNAARLGAPYL